MRIDGQLYTWGARRDDGGTVEQVLVRLESELEARALRDAVMPGSELLIYEPDPSVPRHPWLQQSLAAPLTIDDVVPTPTAFKLWWRARSRGEVAPGELAGEGGAGDPLDEGRGP